METTPKLILVGAGPGDPELITLKGLKAIQRARVILYDALVGEELLQNAPAGCVLKYVGKRFGEASFPQEEINQLIAEYALKYGEVVRLKGGDPFVFGRATEEIDFAESLGIETEVIPGLSSVTAVPAAAKVAITQRNVSRGFRVVTATTSDESLNENLLSAVAANETLVVLMGVNKLRTITDALVKQGKESLPVAIIQNGTLPSQKVVRGKVSEIVLKAETEGISSPAVIVIGESAGWGVTKNDLLNEILKANE